MLIVSPKPSGPEHFQYSEPVISKVTDYIYVGNLNAAYNGRTLLSLIPCTCSRGTRHSWSRLKVDIGDVPGALGDGPALKQRCFEDINECIDASTEKRKRVLVHCRDGFSLAPTCIIQYLMVKQNMRLIAAYELLRAKYPVNIRDWWVKKKNFSNLDVCVISVTVGSIATDWITLLMNLLLLQEGTLHTDTRFKS
uniref:protein-tyrosine-phosphatase n=1 Tax=Seriola dumerili TaxID=41447 RepID=A0A3B4UYE7_SERDU